MTNAQAAPDPQMVKTAIDFVTEMRRLKAYSGLTFRELERRAAASGDAMPYSTIASALRRSGLPQEALVEAFVRACGCTPEQVADWITVRRRLAMGEVDPGRGPDSAPPAERAPAEEPERSRFGRRTASLALFGAAAGTGALLVTVGAATGLFGTEKNHGSPALGAATPAYTGPLDGWYRIKPVSTTGHGDKCLDIGNDRHWRPIVIQWTCAMSNDEQRFRIRTLGGGAYQIQSTSQRAGKSSCLSLNSPSEHAVVRLRPCSDSAADQRFSVERASTRPSFRLRSLAGPSQDCVGLDPAMAAQGADVVQRPCDAMKEQFVLIGPLS